MPANRKAAAGRFEANIVLDTQELSVLRRYLAGELQNNWSPRDALLIELVRNKLFSAAIAIEVKNAKRGKS